MAKKRGLAANRGLDALLGSIKKEKQITATALQGEALRHDHDSSAPTPEAETNPRQPRSLKAAKPNKKPVEMGDDQVSLVQIDVERAVEPERSSDGRDNLSNQAVQIREAGGGDAETLLADIVNGLVINLADVIPSAEG